MTEAVTKAYYLQESEFAVLLAAKGVTEWYGFQIRGVRNLGRADINRTLFNLAKKDVITVSDRGIAISEGLDQIVEAVAGAERILVCSKRDDRFPEQCVYSGSRNVIVQYAGQGGRIRLEAVQAGEIADRVIEVGFYQESIVKGGSSAENSEVKEPERLIKIARQLFGKGQEECMEEKEITAVMAGIRSLDRRTVSRLFLAADGFEDYIIFISDAEEKMFRYSESRLKELIQSMIFV